MNRLDGLKNVRNRGEGILSISISCNGSMDFSENLEIVHMLVEAGVNQVMIITYNTNAGFLGALAPAEKTMVKIGTANGSYENMWEDNVKAVRKEFPELPIIVTPMIGDVITFGQHRFLDKCRELGVDSVDTAMYRCITDPTHYVQDCVERDIGFIPAINGGLLSEKDPSTMSVMDAQVKSAYKELFLVPAIPGSGNGIQGDHWKPVVQRIRRVQESSGKEYPIIGIGGISTPEDARQLVKTAGVDGIHLSSAFMKKLFAGESLGEIGSWLGEFKKAMQS